MTLINIKINDKEFEFHKKLYENLKLLKKANKKDWDFKILISGDGMTRTGKTTIGSQIGCILDNSATEENWCYRGDKLITMGFKLGKGKVLYYDEAKEGLDSLKALQKYSQNIIDYFNECGYLNQYLIIILPDYFDLNKSVALNLSICLINVYITGNFNRGQFGFYNRKDKRYLYIKGKQYKNYNCQRPSFNGKFTNFFPYDYKKLEVMKTDAISARKDKEVLGGRERKYKDRWVRLMNYLYKLEMWPQKKLLNAVNSDKDVLTQSAISKYMSMDYKKRD